MRKSENRLCKAVVKNHNDKSKFESFELDTVREYSDNYDGGTYIEEIKTAAEFLEKDNKAIDDPFYHIYGIYRKGINISGSRLIAEFFHLDQALDFLLELTGEEPSIITY
jgi:hypothetical protein